MFQYRRIKAFTSLNSVMPTTNNRYTIYDIRYTKRGFTLIELLVVVAIIGILATIVMMNVSGARYRGNYARALSDMREIAMAASSYQASHNGVYPGDQNEGVLPTEADFASYFPGASTLPTGPCDSSIWKYDYENWGSCTYDLNFTGVIVGVTYRRTGSPLFYYNIKGMQTCAVNVGTDIRTKDPAQITCKE